jgi:transposase InsO family protein
MVAHEFIDQGVPVTVVLRNVGLSKSTFYYRVRDGKRGRKASTHTWIVTGMLVDNADVIIAIIWLLSQEFVDYGYVKVTMWLRRQGLIINKKKVLNLMRTHRLVLPKQKRIVSGKTWVKDLLPKTELPFDYLEFDIKYIRIDGERRNAMLLTVIDVQSRYNMGHLLQYSIKKQDVIELFDDIFRSVAFPQRITVRSDNGSQFESNLVREYFVGRAIDQEFTKPATPEQNAHIEAYHSIIGRAVCQRIYLDDLAHGQETIYRFRDFYNFDRLHSGIGHMTPVEKLQSLHVEVPKPTYERIVTPQFFNSHSGRNQS